MYLQSLIDDNPKELINDSLKPKDIDNKQFCEVFLFLLLF